MATAPTIAIVGMRALRRDIARQTTDTQSMLYEGIKAAGRAAANPVASATRNSLPRVSGRLAGDVRVSATRTGASVRMGRAAIAYAGWVEFGGTLPQGSTREYRPGGRYLFPAAAGLAEASATTYDRALSTVFAEASIYTNTEGQSSAGSVHD